MRRWLGLGLLVLGISATLGGGAPLAPREPEKFKLPALRQRAESLPFRGGERALVIASGSGVTSLALYVYDADGNCVARDDVGDPRELGGDAAVAWIPPATDRYTVELRNLGSLENVVYLVMR
jgi:hypothetical protein